MKSGETVEILACDPETRKNEFKVLPADLFELVDMIEEDTYCRICLKRSHGESKRQ